MKIIKEIFFNRNILLILAIFIGLFFGDYAYITEDYIFTILMLIMIFSSTGISTKSLFPIKKALKPMAMGIFLNFFVFGFILIALAWWLMPNETLFYGFVVIAATPPGVVIIPFSSKSNGDLSYASLGVLGGFLASIIITPVTLKLFTSSADINPLDIVLLMLELVLIPLIISRVLILPKIKPFVDKVKGRVIDYSFAVIIYTAVGMNSDIFKNNLESLIMPTIVLFIIHFILGAAYFFLAGKLKIKREISTSETLLVTIKSSGFAVVTALELFGKEATIPAALLSIFVLIFLISFSVFRNIEKK